MDKNKIIKLIYDFLNYSDTFDTSFDLKQCCLIVYYLDIFLKEYDNSINNYTDHYIKNFLSKISSDDILDIYLDLYFYYLKLGNNKLKLSDEYINTILYTIDNIKDEDIFLKHFKISILEKLIVYKNSEFQDIIDDQSNQYVLIVKLIERYKELIGDNYQPLTIKEVFNCLN